MGEIAAASGEQSRGIEQVNLAITQMDEVTQQNAALVEEAAAASQSLEDQGRHLTEAVSFFRLEVDAAERFTGTSRHAPTTKRPASVTTKLATRATTSARLAGATAGSHSDWQTCLS